MKTSARRELLASLMLPLITPPASPRPGGSSGGADEAEAMKPNPKHDTSHRRTVMTRGTWTRLLAPALALPLLGIGASTARASVYLAQASTYLEAQAFADSSQFGASCYVSDSPPSGDVFPVAATAGPSGCGGFMGGATATVSGRLGASATASAPGSAGSYNSSEGVGSADQGDWGVVTVPGNGVAQITIVDQVTSDVSGLGFLYEYTDEFGHPVYTVNANFDYGLEWEEGPTDECGGQSCDFEVANYGSLSAYSPDTPQGCAFYNYLGQLEPGYNCLSASGGTTTFTQTFTIANGDALYMYQGISAYAYAGGQHPDGPVTTSIDDPLEILVPDGVTITWAADDGYVMTNEAPANSVPEPPSLLLFAMGLAAAAAMRLKRRRGRFS
ncbi:MAG: PEP-CTERM sorting domain-containing protein [Steroidobacteraceae bacterium]